MKTALGTSPGAVLLRVVPHADPLRLDADTAAAQFGRRSEAVAEERLILGPIDSSG